MPSSCLVVRTSKNASLPGEFDPRMHGVEAVVKVDCRVTIIVVVVEARANVGARCEVTPAVGVAK